MLFLTVGLSFLLSIKTEFIVSVLQRIFPVMTQQFLQLIVDLAEKRGMFGVIGLVISFYFATSIFTSLHTAFQHLFGGREESIKKRAFVYIFGIPIFSILLFTISVLHNIISIILNAIKSTKAWVIVAKTFGLVHLNFLLQIFTNVGFIVQFLSFLLMLLVIYQYLAPHHIKKVSVILYVSLIIASILFGISLMFNRYILLISKANPIYGALSGIFAFLAWIYIIYSIILIGGRMLYYLEFQFCKTKSL